MSLPFREFGTGHPVLALHCSLAHGGAWAGLAGHLPGWKLVAPDLPGHGKAPDWDGESDLHAKATQGAREILRNLPGPVPVIGHSFGGAVALRLALEAPELVERLILFEPVLFAAARLSDGPAFQEYLRTHERFYDLFRAGDLPAASEEFQSIWGTGESFADLPERQRRNIMDRIHLVVAQNGALTDDNAGLFDLGRMEAMKAPVLLVEGALSPPIIPVIHAGLAHRLPKASRVRVEGAGHMLPITHASACAALIRDFVPSGESPAGVHSK